MELTVVSHHNFEPIYLSVSLLPQGKDYRILLFNYLLISSLSDKITNGSLTAIYIQN